MSAQARPAILLVPGWSDTSRVLRPCREYLIDAGWPAAHVRTLSFRDRYGSNIEHAMEIADAVQSLRQDVGAARIAAVAHSMGGLALRHYLTHGGADAVHTAIFAGTPHHGTWVAWLAWGRGGSEMRPGSSFLRELNATTLPSGVRAICLRTPIDTRVLPGESAWLENAACLTVRMPTHQRLLRHRGTLRLVRDLLLDDDAIAA